MTLAPAASPPLSLHYERIAVERQLRDGRLLAQKLGLGRGARVLELGCGTGMLAEILADAVGDKGEVLGLDALPLRVQIAHQKARFNLRFQVGDPYHLARFGDASFDFIVANGVLHTWPDPAAALAACLRLLAPGGSLGLATHSAAHPHPAALAQAEVLGQWPYSQHPPPAEAREYALDAEQLEALLRGAGFERMHLYAQDETLLHASAEAAIEFMQARAWGHFLNHLPAALRAGARAEIVQRLQARRQPEGIRFDARQLFAMLDKAEAAT